MEYKQENLRNIKRRISAETGVRLGSGGYYRSTIVIALAAALVAALGTMGIFAAKQFEISRNVLPGPAAADTQNGAQEMDGAQEQEGDAGAPSDEMTDGRHINGYRISYPFTLNENEYTPAKCAHSGIDIAAPKGTPILAAADGVVRVCEFKGSYGYYVILDHEEGYSTLYAHMEGYCVEAGQEVKTGDKIGTVGSTGLATGPHLHFELREDDEPIDPTDHFI